MRNRYFLSADIIVVGLAAFGAFALRFDLLFLEGHPEFLPYLGVALLVRPLVFLGFGLYRRYWPYATLPDMMALGAAVVVSSALMGVCAAVAMVSGWIPAFSRSILVIDALLVLIMTGAVRLSERVVGEYRLKSDPASGTARRTLVVGAGQAGGLVVRELQRNPQLGLRAVGFLDDDPIKQGKRIHGLPVLGTCAQLEDVAREQRAGEAIIAMPRASGLVVRGLVDSCQRVNIKSRTIPGVFELIGGRVTVTRLRPVVIEDLLRRPRRGSDLPRNEYLKKATVLVTGGGGSIGFELCRQVAHADPSCLVVLGHGENSIFEAEQELRRQFPHVRVVPVIADVRDARRVLKIFRRWSPSVVFHAAAHKHVPLMELHPGEAVSNNILGTRNILDAALSVGTKRLVLVSTDKAVSPSNFMGASKRVAEQLVQEAARQHGRAFVVVRFGNVLGSRGSVVPIFKKQIEEGGPVCVTHPDMKRFFMTIPEAVHLILEAGGLGSGGELFVLNMGDPVRIEDLARDVIKLSGFTTDQIPIAYTGVREGEKLEEALWETGAAVTSMSNPEILAVAEPGCAETGVSTSAVEALVLAAERDDLVEIRARLSELVPTFEHAEPRSHIEDTPSTTSPSRHGFGKT